MTSQEVVTFRQSGLSELLKCPLRYRFGQIEGRPREATSSLVAGTALHYACEQAVRDHQAGHILWVPENYFEDGWRAAENRQIAESATGEIRWDENREKLAAKVYVAFEHWMDNVLPELQPVVSEMRFSELEVAPGIQIEGTLDLVHRTPEGPVIYDWKTSKRAWNAKDVEHNDIQSAMYTLAYRETFGAMPAGFFYYVYVLGNSPRLEVYDATRTEADLDSLIYLMGEYRWMILADLYPPNPSGWWCSQRWCSFWDICPMGANSDLPGRGSTESDTKPEGALPSPAPSGGVASNTEGGVVSNAAVDLWGDNGKIIKELTPSRHEKREGRGARGEAVTRDSSREDIRRKEDG